MGQEIFLGRKYFKYSTFFFRPNTQLTVDNFFFISGLDVRNLVVATTEEPGFLLCSFVQKFCVRARMSATNIPEGVFSFFFFAFSKIPLKSPP